MKLDSMNKKNQYKFLYDVLGNSIIVENLIKELKPKNFRVSLFPRNNRNKKAK